MLKSTAMLTVNISEQNYTKAKIRSDNIYRTSESRFSLLAHHRQEFKKRCIFDNRTSNCSEFRRAKCQDCVKCYVTEADIATTTSLIMKENQIMILSLETSKTSKDPELSSITTASLLKKIMIFQAFHRQK